MDDLSKTKTRLDEMRPLSKSQMVALWPLLDKQDADFVYSSNAIEGNTMTLSETAVVLANGVTIGGKSVREHLEVVGGAAAYRLILEMAKNQRPLTIKTLLSLHQKLLSSEDHAGMFRKEDVFIRSSQHVPPDSSKVPDLVRAMFEEYGYSRDRLHPVVTGANLHFDLLTIHPFVDGNGRTARLLNNLHLLQNGYPPVLIDPSNDKPGYFDVLRTAQMEGEPGRGDPAKFVAYMMGLQERSFKMYFDILERSQKTSIEPPGRRR